MPTIMTGVRCERVAFVAFHVEKQTNVSIEEADCAPPAKHDMMPADGRKKKQLIARDSPSIPTAMRVCRCKERTRKR
jgi:hypothetical protein